MHAHAYTHICTYKIKENFAFSLRGEEKGRAWRKGAQEGLEGEK